MHWWYSKRRGQSIDSAGEIQTSTRKHKNKNKNTTHKKKTHKNILSDMVPAQAKYQETELQKCQCGDINRQRQWKIEWFCRLDTRYSLSHIQMYDPATVPKPNCSTVDHFSRQRFLETWKILVTKIDRFKRCNYSNLYKFVCFFRRLIRLLHPCQMALNCEKCSPFTNQWKWDRGRKRERERERIRKKFKHVKLNFCVCWPPVFSPWYKHIFVEFSLWSDAKSTDGPSHCTWEPKNVYGYFLCMFACVCVWDYFCSLFTSPILVRLDEPPS